MKKTTIFFVFILLVALTTASCTKFPVKPTDTMDGMLNSKILSPFGLIQPIEDKTLPCIEKPAFLKTGYYQKDQNEDYNTTTIVYFSKGDVFEKTKNYFITQTKKCGYKKDTESTFQLNLGEFKIKNSYSAKFYKDKNEDKTLNINIIIEEYNKETYTIVQLELEEYPLISENNNQNYENNSQNNQNENTPYEDITPIGDAKTLNEEVKPILELAVGKIHLVSYGTQAGFMTYLKYQTERKLENSDVSRITEEFTKRGYKLIVADTTSEDSVSLLKNNKMYIIDFYDKGDKLEVSTTPANP